MMELVVHGSKTFCYTGGKPFDAAKPTVIFLHGVLNDHSVWILQTRSLAHHGWNVLAPDLPGHGKSAGDPPTSVEAAADFVLALMDKDEFDRRFNGANMLPGPVVVNMLPPPGLYGRILREVEMPLIEIALDATGGNQAKCADLLGINRNTLRKKITDLDIRVTRRRKLM